MVTGTKNPKCLKKKNLIQCHLVNATPPHSRPWDLTMDMEAFSGYQSHQVLKRQRTPHFKHGYGSQHVGLFDSQPHQFPSDKKRDGCKNNGFFAS
jgi:hypothetical protein